ncbi:MAG: hypothetical protein K0S81_3229, partial [Rhodospirillales bacterium]|nr:hypothetical protein [Rhodospirillales bacterium]
MNRALAVWWRAIVWLGEVERIAGILLIA